MEPSLGKGMWHELEEPVWGSGLELAGLCWVLGFRYPLYCV